MTHIKRFLRLRTRPVRKFRLGLRLGAKRWKKDVNEMKKDLKKVTRLTVESLNRNAVNAKNNAGNYQIVLPSNREGAFNNLLVLVLICLGKQPREGPKTMQDV